MFTVKHLLPSGEEVIYATHHVNYVPAYVKAANKTGEQGEPPQSPEPPVGAPALPGNGDDVWIEVEPHNSMYQLFTGVVYVMNDSGATVAKYDLGGWNPPSGQTLEEKKAA